MGRGFESRRDHIKKRFAKANLFFVTYQRFNKSTHQRYYGRQLFRKAIRRLRKKTRRMGASKKIGQTTQKEITECLLGSIYILQTTASSTQKNRSLNSFGYIL